MKRYINMQNSIRFEQRPFFRDPLVLLQTSRRMAKSISKRSCFVRQVFIRFTEQDFHEVNRRHLYI